MVDRRHRSNFRDLAILSASLFLVILSASVYPSSKMDWFETLTGFPETEYNDTREKLYMDGTYLVSRVNGRRYDIGTFFVSSVAQLRQQAQGDYLQTHTEVHTIYGNVAHLHTLPEYNGALFQVASQFNALEMVSPSITPEDGVTMYQDDNTQGPACAISAGAATIFRNYFVFGDAGQTRERQLDGLSAIGEELVKNNVAARIFDLWEMRNGYALANETGLRAISAYLSTLASLERDALVSKLLVAVHFDTDVTTATSTSADRKPQKVSQILCSALPVSYTTVAAPIWESFAQLILDGVYEATLLAGRINMLRGGNNIVVLTRVGGGVFGNRPAWIDKAIQRAMRVVDTSGLDVRMLEFRHV